MKGYNGTEKKIENYGDSNTYNRRAFMRVLALGLLTDSLASALLNCKSKEIEEKKEEIKLYYNEDEGMEVMMGKCEALGLKVVKNVNREPRYIYLEGKQEKTIPDFFIEFRGKYDALYGEFVSLQEGPEGLERAAIDKYNLTEKEPEGKTIIIDKGKTKEGIETGVENQATLFKIISSAKK